MKLEYWNDMYINEFYLNYLFNDDTEGLTQEEIDNLDELNGDYHISTDTEYNDNFRTCEISGLYANCVEIHLYKRIAS